MEKEYMQNLKIINFNFHKKFRFYKDYNSGFVDHLSNYLSSQIYERIEEGHKTCAIIDTTGSIRLPLHNLEMERKLPDNVAINDTKHCVYLLKNTTFEAAKGNYQIFFNK